MIYPEQLLLLTIGRNFCKKRRLLKNQIPKEIFGHIVLWEIILLFQAKTQQVIRSLHSQTLLTKEHVSCLAEERTALMMTASYS